MVIRPSPNSSPDMVTLFFPVFPVFIVAIPEFPGLPKLLVDELFGFDRSIILYLELLEML